MNLLKRLWREEHGQGLIEYTFVVLLVALSFGWELEIPISDPTSPTA